MRVLIVFAVAALSFACGGAPANNANKPANVVNVANTSVMSTPSNSIAAPNAMTSNSASTMASNSMANKSNTAVKSNSTTNTASANTAVAGKIRGNKATKVYHLPGCPDYDSISPANVVTFATEQDARKAGYKIAGNCK